MDSAPNARVYRFAGWRFDPSQPALSRRDAAGMWREVPLGSRGLRLLGTLLERPGTVLSRDDIIRVVWPATTVEPSNLTVQIAGLRRVLDDGRQGGSLIQTVPGQGYRVACAVEVEASPDDDGAAEVDAAPSPAASASPRRLSALFRRHALAIAAGAALLATVLALVVWRNGWPQSEKRPLVAVSFEDLSGGVAPSALAQSLTEQVASDLARLHLAGLVGAVLVPKGPGDQARYALRGSLHSQDETTSLDVRLVDTQTGTQFWWQRLDLSSPEKIDTLRNAVRRIVSGAGPVVLAQEVSRAQRERPGRPSATDLMLQARLLDQLPPSTERLMEARNLLERALQLDPSSATLKFALINELMNGEDWAPAGYKSVLERTRVLVADLQTTAPNSQFALRALGLWWMFQDGRCPEVIETSRKLIDLYPEIPHGIRWLGRCLDREGRSEEALPWLERAVRIGGASDPWQFSSFFTLADDLLDLGRYRESIEWAQRALALVPDLAGPIKARRLSRIAMAQALAGDVADARQTMAQAQALSPYWTVRGESHVDDRGGPSHARILRMQEGLRLAGVPDHLEAGADYGVAPISALQQKAQGNTSLTLPGAATIDTADVARLIAEGKPIVLDTMSRSLGPSLPGAVGLQYVGAGGSLSDTAQDRLRQTMHALTDGDAARPIIAVGWNSQSFDGVNLVLRLVALGYRNVRWYRDGLETWEANGQPETPLAARDW